VDIKHLGVISGHQTPRVSSVDIKHLGVISGLKQTFIYEKRRFCQNTGINEKFEDIKEIIRINSKDRQYKGQKKQA
jgi:hypothetical protein